MTLVPASSAVGAGDVLSVTAADGSIVVAGTAAAPTVATGALNAIATAHPPVAAVAMNAQRVTGLGAAVAATGAAQLGQTSPVGTIAAGALPTQQLVSGTGAQLSVTRDVESHTPVTFNPGVATTATVTVALSPDNVTYSTLCVVTLPVGVALDGTILDVPVRVPAGWYLKLTVNAQAAIGVTTLY